MKGIKEIEKEIYSLYEKTATSTPDDLILALEKSKQAEINPLAKNALSRILENITLAREKSKPVCQDTGTPYFYVKRPASFLEKDLTNIINNATKNATIDVPLRPNSVDIVTEKNNGNKAVIHFEEADNLEIDLLLKGGGSENISTIYKLPNEELNANRDMDGVRNCILDAVFQAQGKGCPPYIIGVAIGGNIEEVAYLSKKQLLRKLTDTNRNSQLKKLETDTLEEVNQLGIGPMGLGGKTTALAVKITSTERHPATYFVGISFSCWCLRRQKICIS